MLEATPQITATLAFAALVSLAPAATAAPAFSGDWNIKFPPPDGETTDEEGSMKLAGDTGVVCGFYQMPNYSGWISGKVIGDKVEGLWVEDNESGGYSFTFAGNAFKGTFGKSVKEKSGEKGKDYWNGTKVPPAQQSQPVRGLRTADIEWNGLEKLRIAFTINGSAVTGKMTYKYSGEPGGTLKGTLTGNHLVGTWKGSKEGSGRFQLIFQTGPGLRSVKGTYSGSSMTSCNDDGGAITGGWSQDN
jgi:hypothetical protein